MNLKKYIVNKRAIDGDELLSLIVASNGFMNLPWKNYYNAMRISLEARLNTLEKHKWISKRSYLTLLLF